MLDFRWWKILLLPRDASPWAISLMVLASVCCAAALLLIYAPRRIAGELPGGERRALRSWWLRCAHGMAPLAAVGLLAGAYVQIANLSWPRIVVLTRDATRISTPSAERAKQQWADWRQVDARPIVKDAVQRIAQEGGASWIAPQPDAIDRVRLHCRQALTDSFQGKNAPPSDPIQTPLWIIEALEISITEALVAHEKCPAAFLDIPHSKDDAGWGVVKQVAPRELTQYSIEEEPERDSPEVRLLFAGTYDPSSGEVRAQALIDADRSGKAFFRITDRSDQETVVAEFQIDATAGARIEPIQTKVTRVRAGSRLWITADLTGVSSPLAVLGGPETAAIQLSMSPSDGENASLGPTLLRAWNRQLDAAKSQLPTQLERRSQAMVELKLEVTKTSDPSIVALPQQRGLLVLAPGLNLSDVSPHIYQEDNPPLPHPATDAANISTLVPSYGFHAISSSGVADMNSLMSIGVEHVEVTGNQIVLPRVAAGHRVTARGVRPNTTFESGERAYYPHALPGGELAMRPILEEGDIGGKAIVLLRLSIERHLRDDGPALGQNAEQDRERAIVAALVDAANRVTRSGANIGPAQSPANTQVARGFPILTSSDLEEIRQTAQSRGDAWGVLLVALSLFAICGHVWFSRR